MKKIEIKRNELSYSTKQLVPKTKNQIGRITSGFKSSKLFSRFLKIERIFLISILTRMFLNYFYYQISFRQQHQLANIILYLLFAHTCLAIVINFLRKQCFNEWKSSQLKDYQGITLQETLINIAISLIQPYWFLDDIEINNWDYSLKINLSMKLNYLLVLGSIIKLIFFIPHMLNIMKFKNPRSSRVCTIYGCENSSESPVKMIAFIIINSILIFSLAFKIAENNKAALDNKLSYFQNCYWLFLIIMTSVGYGDLYPRTQWGRIIGFICTFWGVLIVSVMIIVVINTFQLSSRQNNSLRILKKVEEQRKLKEKAAIMIRNSLWRLWKNYKIKHSKVFQRQVLEDKAERIAKVEFTEALRQSKFISDADSNIGEDMDRQFQKTHDSLEKLDGNLNEIISYLSQQYFFNIEELIGQNIPLINVMAKKGSEGNSKKDSFQLQL